MAGFTYCGGPYRGGTAKPSSAFSRGGLIMLDSTSSLSGAPALPAASQIFAVAEASSLESLDDQVPYTEVLPGTIFWSDLSSGAVSDYTRGLNRDVILLGGNWYTTSSANTPSVRIDMRGDFSETIDSGVSRIRVQFDPNALLYPT